MRRAGMQGDAKALPYLLARANDWVPQVREAARLALKKLLRPGNAEAFVAALPAIMHLAKCGRDDHRELMQALQEFLLLEENVHRLVAGVNSADTEVARFAARLLVERRRVPAKMLVAAGLAQKDVGVRSIVIGLLRQLDDEAFSAAVAKALTDPYMPVRREAFQQLLMRDVEAGLRVARDKLFDKAASIREIAVRRLLGAGEAVEDIYARALAGNGDRVSVVTCVLWSWGYLNPRSRIEQVRQLLREGSPSVRRSALQTIAKLLRDDSMRDLEVALADESSAVSKEAARLLTRFENRPDAERLIAIARSSALLHVALACGRVARLGSKWGWLEFILKVYGAPDAVVSQEMFSAEIDIWEARFNRSTGSPMGDSMREIVGALRECADKLSGDQLRLLRFTLRGYGARLEAI